MMTITEKILAAHCGKKEVKPGELINAKLDLVLANDITAPISIKEFRAAGAKKVFDPDRIALIPDHFAPNKDIASAEQCNMLRQFSREHDLSLYFEVGRMGVEHALLPEQGIVVPGDVVIGADSHTCTYGGLGAFSTGVGSTDVAAAMITGEAWFKVPESMKFIYKGKLGKWVGGKDIILHTIGDIGVDGALYRAMEFTGEVIKKLPMAGRLTICNMAIEAGGKNGIIEPDEITEKYVAKRARRKYKFYKSDKKANYADVREYDLTGMEPQIACPHLPENVKPVSQLGADQYRPVRGRLLHQRQDRGHARSGQGHQRPQGPSLCAHDRDPGHAGDLQTVHQRRPRGHLHRCGRGIQHADLRPVPRRPHGHSRRGRARHCHDEPQLCRQDGLSQERSVSVQPGHSSGIGGARQDRKTGRAEVNNIHHGAHGSTRETAARGRYAR